MRDSLEGEDAERPVGLVAGVLGHALAPEAVGEDAPAERGAGPRVGLFTVAHQLALQGTALAQAACACQQRSGPGHQHLFLPTENAPIVLSKTQHIHAPQKLGTHAGAFCLPQALEYQKASSRADGVGILARGCPGEEGFRL